MRSVVPLGEADCQSQFGGKAANLSKALQAGLRVPAGYGLDVECVRAIENRDSAVLAELAAVFSQMKKPIAVRSSAIDEDSDGASFAGQHTSVLNICTEEQLDAAIAEVIASGLASSAQSYRDRLGVEGSTNMAIVLQELFAADAAGVLFTRNPISGAEERVIEAAWGLGEVVVSGLVIPDYYRLDLAGNVLERKIGDKDIALHLLPEGGTEEVEIPREKAMQNILDDEQLLMLHQLAVRCETVYGKALDIEWGIAGGELVLLQCRPITASKTL